MHKVDPTLDDLRISVKRIYHGFHKVRRTLDKLRNKAKTKPKTREKNTFRLRTKAMNSEKFSSQQPIVFDKMLIELPWAC